MNVAENLASLVEVPNPKGVVVTAETRIYIGIIQIMVAISEQSFCYCGKCKNYNGAVYDTH